MSISDSIGYDLTTSDPSGGFGGMNLNWGDG